MTGFRNRLYTRYYSEFARNHLLHRHSNLQSYFRWLDCKLWRYLADLPRDTRILELGCGVGDFIEYLKSKGFSNVSGIDACEECVHMAQSKGHEVFLADATQFLAASNSSIGVVVALDFIEHLSQDELFDLLDILLEKLQPGGRVIFQTPNAEGLFPAHVAYGDLTHLTILSPPSLHQILVAAGFTKIQFAECGPAPKNLQGAIRLILWKIIRSVANVIRIIEVGAPQDIWTENMICVAEKPAEPTPSP